MSRELNSTPSPVFVEARAAELLDEHRQEIHQRTDRMFAGLMAAQWLFAIGVALWISPRAWAGEESWTHPHVWAAVGLGGAITLFPVWQALTHPGAVATRHAIAVGQMLMSALLIHLTGGRIETHFHVFGSLAFLAFYRDWTVFIPATVVVAGDHLWRGLFWPESVFGIVNAGPWRWLEHAGWVVFEDAFLIASCRRSVREMSDIAHSRAQLEATQKIIEAEVAERTAELQELQKRHLDAARRAGMADIATSVLHNVGNVLNSVNVSASIIGDTVQKSGTSQLKRATDLLENHLDDPAEFVGRDERGKHLPRFLIELSRKMTTDEETILSEVRSLSKGIDHIKSIVSVQQTYAGRSGFVEEVSLTELVEDAIRMNATSLGRHRVEVVREVAKLPSVEIDKQKLLQILVNLLSNAKHAVIESGRAERRITIRVGRTADERLNIEVIDNGVGLSPEHLTRVFSQGFTTRKEGHGFGLHSAALLAGELGGRLAVHSDGPGAGATFSLNVPLNESRSRACSQTPC